jgi:glutaredoxin
MTSLLTRLLRRQPRTEHLTFTVYSRAQCCCCHKAIDVLKDAQHQFGFAIEEVDIDRDPELVSKFDTEVPVVAVNGKVRFRGVVNPALLERLLLAESRDRPETPRHP